MDDLIEYKKRIKHLAEGHINEMIYNTDDKHAVVVLSELIKNADDYVHIVCKNMDPLVTDKPDYCYAVESFLKKENSKEMKILLTDYDDSLKKSEIFKILKKYPEKVSISYFEPKVKILSNGTPLNWTVADDKAIRIEIDIDNYIAIGNFYDPNLAKKYNNNFEAFSNLKDKYVQVKLD